MVQYQGDIDVETLEQECSRLQNAIRHLISSNSEIQEAIQAGDDDRELLIATEVRRGPTERCRKHGSETWSSSLTWVQENQSVIVKYQTAVATIQAQMEALRESSPGLQPMQLSTSEQQQQQQSTAHRRQGVEAQPRDEPRSKRQSLPPFDGT